MISLLKEKVKTFFLKWYKRFKIFVYIYAIWAVIYSTVNISGFSVAFEYEDGLAYTTDTYLKAKTNSTDELHRFLNENAHKDRIKIIPFFIYKTLKILGFSIDIIVDRKNISSETLTLRWKNCGVYFVSNSNEKYELLNKKKYLLFFANSDDGIIQAKKAQIYPLRIKRNPKSLNPANYNPSKYGEKVIPFSEF